MVSDLEVHMKHRYVAEFMWKKIVSTDIHRRLLSISGDRTVDVSTVRQWVVRFNSGDGDMKGKQYSRQPCTAATP